VVVACLAFTAFDLREVAHQAGESRTGLALVAALVAALHLAAAATALALWRRPATEASSARWDPGSR
jgi:hypothetical protein